jgi:hypothetical protein
MPGDDGRLAGARNVVGWPGETPGGMDVVNRAHRVARA